MAIGYCRKSPLRGESIEKRIELLQAMILKLKKLDLCHRVYVSPICESNSKIIKRDELLSDEAKAIYNELQHADGTMQGRRRICSNT